MMEKKNFLLPVLIWSGALFIFFVTPLAPFTEGTFTSPVFAQGHAGHTAQPAAPAPAKEKPKVVLQPAEGKATPQEQSTEEVPQIELSSEQIQRIGVKTAKVTAKPLKKIIRTVGRVEADERKQATINAKIEGWIEKLHVNYTGSYVKKGEPLAEIYSPELLATQQEFIALLKWSGRKTVDPHGAAANESSREASVPDIAGHQGAHESAPAAGSGHEGVHPAPPAADPEPASSVVSELQRMLAKDADNAIAAARQRLRLWDVSDAQIGKIEATGQPIRTLTLYSPATGFITQKMAVQGMRVMPGEKLFDVADLSTLWIIADIYEYELSLIRVGQTARVSLAYLPGRELTSRIDYIYPTIAPDTRTAKVRLSLPNPNGQLKPQMYTNIEIGVNLGRRLSVPDSAVIDTGKGQVVYVDRGGGVFEPREVQLGLRADGYTEVLRGLKAGERVAASANFLIDSEAQLKGVKPLKGQIR